MLLQPKEIKSIFRYSFIFLSQKRKKGKLESFLKNPSTAKMCSTAHCSKNMERKANCSKEKVEETNYSKDKEGKTNCNKNMEREAHCSKGKEGKTNCSKGKTPTEAKACAQNNNYKDRLF